MLVGAVITLVVNGVYHLRDVPFQWVIAAGLIPMPLMLLGALIAGWRKPAMNEVARWVDGKRNLKERVSTALEVSKEETGGRWRDLIVTEYTFEKIDGKTIVIKKKDEPKKDNGRDGPDGDDAPIARTPFGGVWVAGLAAALALLLSGLWLSGRTRRKA